MLEVGDGIARIYGLSGVMAGELLEFPNGAIGQVFNLEENSVGAVILGDYLEHQRGRRGPAHRRAAVACPSARP